MNLLYQTQLTIGSDRKDFAKQLGISLRTLQRYERSELLPFGMQILCQAIRFERRYWRVRLSEPLVVADVAEARAKIGLTQKEMAGLFQVSVDSIRHWEKCRSTPPGYVSRLTDDFLRRPFVWRQLIT